jgi:Fe2+ or Zn2+ uptake regulation protein
MTSATLSDPAALLRGAGLRVTRPRVAVLSALEAAPHASADTVLADVRRAMGAVSVQAVYDVLNTLTEHGLIRRIQPAGSVARYEERVGDNHHHVVCRSCGTTADIDCVKGEAPCLEPNVLPSGFVLDEAEVTYWGLCASCRAAAANNLTTTTT